MKQIAVCVYVWGTQATTGVLACSMQQGVAGDTDESQGSIS